MVTRQLTEAEAWSIVTRPLARKPYQHINDFNRQKRRQANWLKRVDRTPGGCWLWTGSQCVLPGGSVVPIYYVRKTDDKGRPTRVSRGMQAAIWGINEWFPKTGLAHRQRTRATCGNSLCVNPLHRTILITKPSNTKLTPDQVRTIYQARGRSSAAGIARQFGINSTTVSAIWSGKRWSDVTGATYDPVPTGRAKSTVVLSADQIEEIRADRGKEPGAVVAKRYGIDRKRVYAIWGPMRRDEIVRRKPAKPPVRRLTMDQVREVYLAKSTRSAAEVADQFGISVAHVYRVWDGRRWGKATEHLRQEQVA